MNLMYRKWLFSVLIVCLFGLQTGGAAVAAAGKTTAFVHVNLVPMTAEKILADQTVLVRGSKIAAIGPANQISIPGKAIVIKAANAYLMPGLADMHVHIYPDWVGDIWPVSPFYLFIASGVTTIRNFGTRGCPPEKILQWRSAIQKGKITAPHIYTCGRQLRGHLNQPERRVRQQKQSGFDFIKLYSFLTKDEFSKIMSTARAIDIYAAGHIPFQIGLDGVVEAGMDEIAHIEELFWELVDFDRARYFDHESEWMRYVITTAFHQFKPYLKADSIALETQFSDKMARIAQKLKKSAIPVCTTLFLDELIVEKLFNPQKFLSEAAAKYLPQSYLAAFRQGREKHQVQFSGGEVFAPFKRQIDLMLLHHLKKAGVSLLLATDAGTGRMGLVPGFSLHDELRVLTLNGFTPYEAIKTATVDAAKVIKKMVGKAAFGTIEVGKRADLLLLNGNPLDDINVLSKPAGVMAAGRWFDQAALADMLR